MLKNKQTNKKISEHLFSTVLVKEAKFKKGSF